MRQSSAWTRRGLALLVAGAVAWGVAGEGRAAETIGQEVVNGIEWNFVVSDGHATVGLGKSTLTAIPTDTAGDVSVPATLGGAPVTAIGACSFYGCTNVTSFALPESVASIGSNAFQNCKSATSISIPNAVTNFGPYAFNGCAALQQCVIPPLLETLPRYVFAGCTSFREVVVPNTVKWVYGGAFSSCTGLVSAIVNASEGMSATIYTESAEGIFRDCKLSSLTIRCPVVGGGSLYRARASRLVLEEGVKSIGRFAFWSSRFAEVSFPDSLTSIHSVAFGGYYEGSTPTLPFSTNAQGVVMLDGWATGCVATNTAAMALDLSGVRGILDSAFVGRDFESVSMPDIRALGSNCFYNCVALQSVSIGNQLKSVGPEPFRGCTRLKDAVLAQGMTEVFDTLFSGCSGLESVTLPDSVSRIGDYAFANCSGLARIDLPEGLTNIGDRAFFGCSGLERIDFPAGLTDIGTTAFGGCSGLKSIDIPDGVENLTYSFSDCTGLESVSIPASVTNAAGTFYGCEAIRTAVVPGRFTLSSLLPHSYPKLASVSLVEGTTSICDRMFNGCAALSEVVIPAGVTNIGEHAFSNCGDLLSVMIPEGVAEIGTGAFSGCQSLASVVISEGVENIGDDAFYCCSSLACVTIPASVTNIGKSAFDYCSTLQDVYLSDLAAWCAIPFGNAVASPFYYAQNLYLDGVLVTALVIPDGVESIGPYAFYNCDCLTSVSIPDSVKTIGGKAFYGCDNLSSVRVPQAVMTQGLSSVFAYSCGKLQHLCLGADVAAIGQNEFARCPALTKIEVAEGNTHFAVSADGCLYDTAKTTLHVCPRNATAVDLPDGLAAISPYAFQGCGALAGLVFPESVASIPATALEGCGALWTEWYRALSNLAAGGGASGGESGGGTAERVSLTVTNVVVHYVMQSVPSGAVTPDTASTGIVNVIAEVGAGKAVAIPSSWADQYPGFEAKFGNDFGAALTTETGKRDGAGNAMFVWQDYVAGTDPTDPASVFTASLTFAADTGAPIISWSPELSVKEAAKRKYTIYGKVRMLDEDWIVVDGNAADFNFFKVSVEMK